MRRENLHRVGGRISKQGRTDLANALGATQAAGITNKGDAKKALMSTYEDASRNASAAISI
jgi:hypothetical protein